MVKKVDPYVVMKYENIEYRTNTIYNGLNLEWNLTAKLKIPNDTIECLK